jgi:hypothetical protein
MSSANLNKVLEAVKSLTLDEQCQLRARLDEQLDQKGERVQMQDFHQALMASGLVRAIRVPDPGTSSQRRLIDVKGKPLSQTIIEERR